MADGITGTYQCFMCSEIWDGSEVYVDPQSLCHRLTCGNLYCGATVRKISDLPKEQYLKKQGEKR